MTFCSSDNEATGTHAEKIVSTGYKREKMMSSLLARDLVTEWHVIHYLLQTAEVKNEWIAIKNK